MALFKKKEQAAPTYKEETEPESSIEESKITSEAKKSKAASGIEEYSKDYAGIIPRQEIVQMPAVEKEGIMLDLLFSIYNELRILNKKK